MLDAGQGPILTTDAPGANRRPPLPVESRRAAECRVGAGEAVYLDGIRPQGILDNAIPYHPPPVVRGAGFSSGFLALGATKTTASAPVNPCLPGSPPINLPRNRALEHQPAAAPLPRFQLP